MNFANHNVLWLLLVFPPALGVFFWWALRERRRLMTLFIESRLLPGLISGLSPARMKFRCASVVAAVALILLALARPQWGFTWQESKQRGLDIVVAIDTSKSMLAEDIAPNRLQRAKLAALDLMRQAKSDRLGLVAFAGSAFLQCPLTVDENAFRQSVDTLDVNIIPQGGTALSEAIKTALEAYKEGDNFKILVLFTDGEDTDEGALEAAQAAAKQGMKIFTVGVGTPQGEILRTKDAKGRTEYIRDPEGNAVKSKLNENLLREVAAATEGGYLQLGGTRTMETLYATGLAPLPKSEGQEKLVKQYFERYHWPLAAAVLLLLAEILLPESKREKRVASENQVKSQGKLQSASPARATVVALITIGMLLLPCSITASPGSAMRHYQAGNFGAALKDYQEALEKGKEDLRLHFNAGAAAYRLTNYTEAAKYFTAAANAPDLKLQQSAYFNLGNTQFRLGEASEDLDALEAQWAAAIKSYQSAATLNKEDKDAEYNLAFVKSAVEQVKQLRELAKRMRAEADQSLRQRQYHRALEIMEALLQQNIAAKPFKEFTEKLKNIDGIANPPQNPAPRQP